MANKGASDKPDRAVAASPSSPSVSPLRASTPSAALPERLRELGGFIATIEADIPEPTCSSIDAVLRDIAEPRRKADQLVRNKPDSRDLEEFAGEVDDALWCLPDQLEQLRHDNCQLRDAVHHLGSYCHDAGRLLLEAAQAIETGDAFTNIEAAIDHARWMDDERRAAIARATGASS